MIVWRKSSHSGTQDESECVEVAGLLSGTARAVGVRDSKQADGPVLAFSRAEFGTFLDHVRADAIRR